MLTNLFKLAWRNLLKNKSISAINLLGLSAGLTAALLIFQYVLYERSYDSFTDHADRVWRLQIDKTTKGELEWQSATVFPAFGPTMKKDFPEVEDFCRLIDAETLLANEVRNIRFAEKKGYYADPATLDILGVELQQGNPETALSGPDKIVLSQKTAQKYFGVENPLGKTLTVPDADFPRKYEVTGVFEDYPTNSHLILDYLVSYSTLGNILRMSGDTSNATETAWGWYDFYIYYKLRPDADAKALEAKLPAFCDRYMNNEERMKLVSVRYDAFLKPLRSIHLDSHVNQEAEVNADGQGVNFLYLIAFFVLAIAWVNFINLSTARSMERAREVGVHKVLGAFKRQLVAQFMTESFVLNLVAVLIALGVTWIMMPTFGRLVERDFSGVGLFSSLSGQLWTTFGLTCLVGIALSGLYPAFVMSSYQPIAVLKGALKGSPRGNWLRKGLIVFQFAASIALMVGTVVVLRQLNYMRNQPLGFEVKQTMVLEGVQSLQDSAYTSAYSAFKQDLLQIPGIQGVTASSTVPGNEIYWTNSFYRAGQDAATASRITMYRMACDYDFLKTYNIEVLEGRPFDPKFGENNRTVLLNESAAKDLGFASSAEAVNGYIMAGTDSIKVIGVVSDFHQEGLQKVVMPMMISYREGSRNFYSAKIESRDYASTIASVQGLWAKHFPADPFDYFFLDEHFQKQYRSDILFGQVFGFFTLLAILVACLGLFGLASYQALQRRKEIGIRKVLGATATQVTSMLAKEFVRLVLVSIVIAVPLSMFIMQKWLQNFAYRTNIPWWAFVVAAVVAVLIAVVTVSLQSVRAALANPVNALRSE